MHETVSFCIHGTPVKLGCKNCIDEAVNNKEFCVSSFAFAIRCCIDTLEERVRRLQEYMQMEDRVTASDVLMRLTKLEEICSISICNAPPIGELWTRISHLEKSWSRENKKVPHKCPLCLGEGKIQTNSNIVEPFEVRHIDSLGRHFKKCIQCDGTGILWG